MKKFLKIVPIIAVSIAAAAVITAANKKKHLRNNRQRAWKIPVS